MKYKGKMKFEFTVKVSADTDFNVSENRLKQVANKNILQDLKCYVGISSASMSNDLLYEYEICSVKRIKE